MKGLRFNNVIRRAAVLCSLCIMLSVNIAIGQYNNGKDILENSFRLAEQQYCNMLKVSKKLNVFPRSTGKDGKIRYTDVADWTGGFWAGGLWYLYENSGDAKWKQAAVKWTEALAKGQYNTAHHDVGFVMYCSYGNAWRLTGDPEYKKVLLQSAESLSSRFNPKVGSIMSWNPRLSWDGKTLWKFPVIIDNMINLELLFYASKVSGNPRYSQIAISHAEKVMQNHVRPDYSSYHVINYDPQTGKVQNKETNQGFANNSTWARGQGWGIYGFTMAFRETGDKRFLETACGMADFYLNHSNLPADKVPYWDFNTNQPGYTPVWKYDPAAFSEIPRDASAAAIVSSALFELSTYSKENQEKYYTAAVDMLRSLSSQNYLAAAGTNNYFILKHSVGSIPHGFEVDSPLIYADYYFLEALSKYKASLVTRKKS